MDPESFNDALIDAVKACGGSKVIGLALWPSKGVEAAQKALLACLNPDRQEKLSLDEIEYIARSARDRGCHVVMNYLARALNYAEPIPVKPQDVADTLRRELLEEVKALQSKLDRLNVLDNKPPLRGVA